MDGNEFTLDPSATAYISAQESPSPSASASISVSEFASPSSDNSATQTSTSRRTNTGTNTATHTRLPIIICGASSSLEGTWMTHVGAGVSNYADNTNCQTVFTAPSDKLIRFTKTSEQLEECCDSVSLHDGPSISSPVLAYIKSMTMQAPYSWTTTGNTMTIRFTTDGSVIQTGVVGRIAFVDPPTPSSTRSALKSSSSTRSALPSVSPAPSAQASSSALSSRMETETPRASLISSSSASSSISAMVSYITTGSELTTITPSVSAIVSREASSSGSPSVSAIGSLDSSSTGSPSASTTQSAKPSTSGFVSQSRCQTQSISQSRTSRLTVSASSLVSGKSTRSQSLTTSVSPSALSTPKPKGPPPPLPPLGNLSLADLNNLFNDLSTYEPTQLVGALNSVGLAAMKQSGGEFGISTEAFSLKMKALDAAAPATLKIGGTNMSLPPLSSLGKGLAASMIQWTSNPYASQSSTATDTLPLSLNVLDSDGLQLNVQNLKTPIQFGWTLDTSLPKFQTPPLYMANCLTNELYVKYNTIYEPFPNATPTGPGTWNLPCLLGVIRPLNCTSTDLYKTLECPRPILTPNCLYWNTNTSGWSSDGCTPIVTNTTMICSCSHLTDFTSRIDAVGEANKALFANAANVYSLAGLLKYASWYGIFGGIALLTIFLGMLAMRIDIITTKKYVKQLCQDPVIQTVFDNAPNSAIYVFDAKSTKKCKKIKPLVKDKKNHGRVNLCQRVCQQHSRIQFLFRFDPRLARVFRLMALFTIQYHSLFITALFYGFTYGTGSGTSNTSDMAWYEVIILSILTSALNIPVVSLIISSLNKIGLQEFRYKFPLLYEEYTRRSRFEKYALVYLDKREKQIEDDSTDENQTNQMIDSNDQESIQDRIMMYLCCRQPKDEDEEDMNAQLLKMPQKELLVRMIKVIKAKYPGCEVHSSFWSYMPCHTVGAWLFLICSGGWLAWCLNYLLLFAAAHDSSVGQSVMISYATSELTTVFLSQPLTIIVSYMAFKCINRYGKYLPTCLQRFVPQSNKKGVPPHYFFSNPWTNTADSAFTSKFAYSLFIRCPALASDTNELAYAPTRAITHDVEINPPPCKVEELYTKMMAIKGDLHLRVVR